MAETETPDGKNVIKIEEEIEGDLICTKNYRFSRIGEPVPIKSDADFKFDEESVPRRPLAVSEKFGVIFVAHPSGFCVARTKDVMDTAKELKNGGNGSCIQELGVADVPLGKVSILALSPNSSMLAASVEHNLYFFSVAGLLNKDHEPSFSKSPNGSSCIKDMQWSTHLEDQYVVLTTDGNLYRGAGQDVLSNLMDNVDAVNWSMNGKFLAVAKYEYVIILSSKFEEKSRIKLSFDSLLGDSDANCVVKVDCVRWVRPNCLILGCYCQSPDGKEDNYLLQFITVKDGKITNPSSNPVALTFCDAFLTINDDYIPFGNGPYMLVNYLDECDVAFATHRKSTDQHIVLFGWSSDEKNEAKMIEISDDAWLPTISLQDNSDDNLILGFAVNKAYQDDNIRFVLGEEDTEVSPCCVLLCLTLDGKLFMFHFASATGPSVLSEDVISVSDEEEVSSSLGSQQRIDICNEETQIGDQALNELQPQKVKMNESSFKTGYEAHMRSGDEQTKSTAFPKLLLGGTQQDVPVARLNDSRDEARSLPSQKQDSDFVATLFKASEPVNPEAVKDLKRFEDQEVARVKSSADSVSNSAHDKSDSKHFGVSLEDISASRKLPVNKESTGFHGSSGSFSSGSVFSSNIFGVQSSSSSHAGVQGSAQQDLPFARLNDGRDNGQSLSSQKHYGNSDVALIKASEPVNPGAAKDLKRFENQEVAGVKSSAASISKSANDKSDDTLFGASFEDRRASREFSVNKASTGLDGSSGSFSSGSVFSSNTFGMQSFSSPHAGVQGSAELSGKPGSTNLHVPSGSFSSGGIFSSKTFDVKSPLAPHAAVQGNRHDTSAGVAQFSSGPQKISFPKMISGPSTSSNLLGQGASTGAGFTLPVVSNVQPILGKSSAFEFSDKGNQRSHTPPRLLSSEPNLSEQRSVEEMAKELDALLNSIEGPGGFYDASVAAHKPSVTALEEGIWVLSDKCRKWINTMDRGIGEVQLLLDKTVQVLARKIYMEAIVKQATDSQYLDIWNRQKLNSELDMKRKHILEINQNLTNQLIELERHLNTLELQRFGDNRSDVLMNRRSSHTKHGPPRHIQSLHSLHNTMNAQLAAAEKLSECLSKQMAVLSIETEPVKNQNVKKELFDTIGISYDDTTFSSPGQEKSREILLKSKVLVPSCSTAANTNLKKSQQGAVKSSEPETARRRRDSLDRNWASIEPPKTTVKRILLQEDRQMSPGRLSLPTGPLKLNHQLSEGSMVSHDIPRGVLNISQSKGSQDVQIKRHFEGQSNSSLWDSSRSDSSKTPAASVLSLGSGSKTMPIISQDAARNLNFTLKSDPVVVNNPKFSQQLQSFPEASSNSTGSLAKNIFQKKSIEFSESSNKDTVKSKFAVGNGNQRPIVAESSSIWSRKSQESPFSAVSSAGSGTAFSGRSFSLEASTRESQVGEAVSSSIASLPVPVTSAPTSFVFKDAIPSTISAISLSKSSTNFGIKLGATSTLPLSGSSASFPSFPSTPSFGATREPMISSSIEPLANVELNTSKLELSKSNLDTSEISTPHVVSMPKFDLKPDVKSSAQTSPPQPVLSSGAPDMKLGFSVPSEPTTRREPSTIFFSGSQLNLSATNSPVLASNSKAEQPAVAPALSSSPAISNPVEEVGKENDNSDVALTQEDEMEEEAPDTTQIILGNLGGFGLGSAPNPGAPKQNPFGAPFGNAAANTPITSFTSPSTGGLFRPASFNIASSQPSQPSQQTNFGGFSSGFGSNNNQSNTGLGFGSNNNQSNTGQGFGQPARIGSGQQALGSVLGSFGQSRQFGAGLPGSVASPSPFGSGFGGSQTAGGFATASSSGGFANLASGGGGFGSLATSGGGFAAAPTGGGFAAAPTGGGGFAAAATGSVGFGGAPAGGGFAGAAPGGFGAFGSQGGSGFSAFGSTGGTGRPPSELFTQMRR
ncbi:nuclear pore complex protein NUP214 isoform X2 [Cynara cardunculus var. scolymus]|uniref:nuclear pore complex protein NUP214 isoform X2 n=1 Tax=Cynara cardunculus var. scolymus TaxID=59895 RepID=UPI000D62335D|nr:nuclear pore complex protein NUP214 isoform X2 [Cynara cardunculus var. scolymus]